MFFTLYFAFWELKKHFKNKTFIMCQHTIALGYDEKYHPNLLYLQKNLKKKKKLIIFFCKRGHDKWL